ncbi:MAG: hypothetical protein Q7R64_02780 [bacterium]|nr:hypothetical protein [bacterium]
MKDFKHNSKFGGGNKGGDRGGFSGGNRFGKKNWDGPKEMHKAVCAKCQKTCEVPFRPSGDRPVYCHDCFDKTKSNTPTGNFSRNEGDNFPKRDFNAPPTSRPDGNTNNRQIEDIKRQLDVVIAKLDRLLQKVEGSKKESVPPPAKESLKEIVASVMEVPQKAISSKSKKEAGKKAKTKRK